MSEIAQDSLAGIQRFVVYLEEGSAFKPNLSLTVINLRQQSKGLGSCALKYLPKNTFEYDKNIVISKPKTSQRFMIIDTKGLTEIPKSVEINAELNVIFYGRIRTVALDKYKDVDDYTGEVAGDEEGWFYSQQAMFNCADIPFNPVVTSAANGSGYYLANKKDQEELAIEKYNPKKLKDSEVAEMVWSAADKNFIWSLEEAIKFVGDITNIDFKFPWDADEERITQSNSGINVPAGERIEDQPGYISPQGNKEKYKIFLDKVKPKSFTSPYGKTPIDWLNENLLDNFTYKFRYVSSGYVTCDIINTSLVDTELFPKAILPTSITINNRNTNVSVTEVGETYTQVEVVSNRILFAGTLTTKNLATEQKTMDRAWEYSDEKNYAFGSTTGAEATHPDVFRKSFKNQGTYQSFKFVKDPNSDCPITVSAPMNLQNEFTQRNKTPFFPFVGVVERTGELTISSSMNSHQTPDTSNIAWAQTLPFGYTDALSKYNLFEPFVSITVTVKDAPNEKSILHLCGGTDKPGLDLGDSITIKQNPPQAFGYIDNDAKLFEINGQTFVPSTSPASGEGGSYDWALGSSPADIDPGTTSLGVYKHFTHWSMIYLTLAGYSAQRISMYKVKDNPGIATRRKVIQADDCEYWIVHPGTFKPSVTINADATKQGYAWVPEFASSNLNEPKVIRNDSKKQKSYLDMYSAFLFLEKKAITLDYTLDEWNNTFKIGQPIGSIYDRQSIVTNSVVESIEYFVEGTTPRIRISTLIPELPPLKKLGEQIRINSDVPAMSQMTKYKDSSITTTEDTKKINVTTIQGIGGGGVGGKAYTENQLLIVGGNKIDNVPCVKAYTESISGSYMLLDVELPSADSTTVLPDGIGRAWLYRYTTPMLNSDGLQSPDGLTGRVYVVNYQREFGGYPLMVGSQLPTYEKVTIEDSEAKKYTAYIPAWR